MSKIISLQRHTFKVMLLCDCGREMIKQDVIIMQTPAEYTYMCPLCYITEISPIIYPYIEER